MQEFSALAALLIELLCKENSFVWQMRSVEIAGLPKEAEQHLMIFIATTLHKTNLDLIIIFVLCMHHVASVNVILADTPVVHRMVH